MEEGKETKDSAGRSAVPSVVIDWDGDKAPTEWRKGWGGFPGAEYLGLKRKTKNKPEGQQNEPIARDHNKSEEDQKEPVVAPPSMPDTVPLR